MASAVVTSSYPNFADNPFIAAQRRKKKKFSLGSRDAEVVVDDNGAIVPSAASPDAIDVNPSHSSPESKRISQPRSQTRSKSPNVSPRSSRSNGGAYGSKRSSNNGNNSSNSRNNSRRDRNDRNDRSPRNSGKHSSSRNNASNTSRSSKTGGSSGSRRSQNSASGTNSKNGRNSKNDRDDHDDELSRDEKRRLKQNIITKQRAKQAERSKKDASSQFVYSSVPKPSHGSKASSRGPRSSASNASNASNSSKSARNSNKSNRYSTNVRTHSPLRSGTTPTPNDDTQGLQNSHASPRLSPQMSPQRSPHRSPTGGRSRRKSFKLNDNQSPRDISEENYDSTTRDDGDSPNSHNSYNSNNSGSRSLGSPARSPTQSAASPKKVVLSGISMEKYNSLQQEKKSELKQRRERAASRGNRGVEEKIDDMGASAGKAGNNRSGRNGGNGGKGGNPGQGSSNTFEFQLTRPMAFSQYQGQFKRHDSKGKGALAGLNMDSKRSTVTAATIKSNPFMMDVGGDGGVKMRFENSDEQKIGRMSNKQINNAFGKSLASLEIVELPKYPGGVPRVLIELKRRLRECDGVKKKMIFHVAVKSNQQHHVIAALIKSWFSALPQPLLSCVSTNVVDGARNIQLIPKAVEQFPQPQQSILLWLWDLMADVCQATQLNRMTSQSCAQAFGPLMTRINEAELKKMKRATFQALFASRVIVFMKRGIEWRLSLRE